MPNAVTEIGWLLPALYALAVLLVLLILGDLLEIFPNLLACIFSSKENVAIYNQTKSRVQRNQIFFSFIPATILVLCSYGANVFVLLTYVITRCIIRLAFTRRQHGRQDVLAGVQVPFTFFILGSILIWLESGVLMATDLDEALKLRILAYPALFIYAVCLLREMQVFTRCRGFFSAFLYLCALEFLPATILVWAYFN